jgi:hypothetical protein
MDRSTDSAFGGVIMALKRFAACAALLLILPVFSGCWYVAAAGAGAYGGYKAKESGYSVQNPVTKDGTNSNEKKSSE